MTTEPKEGDVREGPCTWCNRPTKVVYTRYPAHLQISGFFWDCSACSCGSKAGFARFSFMLTNAGRRRTRPYGEHKSVAVDLDFGKGIPVGGAWR